MDRFSVGADPEFSCFKSGKYIQACNLYPSCRISGGRSFSLMFGYDGANQTGEIRPAPTYEAEDFANNVRKCLALGYRIIASQRRYDEVEEKIDELMEEKEIKLKAGSYWRHPLGGHIHLGIRDFQKELPSELEECFLKPRQKEYFRENGRYWKKKDRELWRYRYFIVNMLDSTVGLGLKLLENWERGQSRSAGYGHFSAFKNAPWGIEYRTPPSFIVSPEIVKAVFELVQLSIYNIVDRTEITTNLLAELGLIDINQEWRILYQTETRDKFRSKFRGNWLKAIPSLDKFKEIEGLNPILDLVENEEEWEDEISLFESWGIDRTTFKSLEFIDPTNYYGGEDLDYGNDAPRERREPSSIIEDTMEYDERLVQQYEDGEISCLECGSSDVERQNGSCLQCLNEDCRHHICDYFIFVEFTN